MTITQNGPQMQSYKLPSRESHLFTTDIKYFINMKKVCYIDVSREELVFLSIKGNILVNVLYSGFRSGKFRLFLQGFVKRTVIVDCLLSFNKPTQIQDLLKFFLLNSVRSLFIKYTLRNNTIFLLIQKFNFLMGWVIFSIEPLHIIQ